MSVKVAVSVETESVTNHTRVLYPNEM